MSTVNPVLARKLGRSASSGTDDDPKQAPGLGRILRMALLRAADRAIGLSLSVLGIAEATQQADALIEESPDGWMVLGLCHPGTPGLAGLVLIDRTLRTAMIEVQTIGMLLEAGDSDRPVTATDAALSSTVVEEFLAELTTSGASAFATELPGVHLRPMPDLTAAGLAMRDGLYRSWRMSLQIGGTERQGEMILALAPAARASEPERLDERQGWSQDLRGALEEAPARLDAVLCRLNLPISTVDAFETGQVLRLSGVTVGSVTLEGPGEAPVAPARLGQVAGQRAVRLEIPVVEMQDSHGPTVSADTDTLLARGEGF